LENTTITLTPLSSGSKGNCTLIQTPDLRLLIDAGLSAKKTNERLAEVDLTLNDIAAIFITHEHSDHIGGAGVVSRKANIPLFMREGTYNAAHSRLFTGAENCQFIQQTHIFGETQIEAVSTSHDAADSVAYKVTYGGKSVGVVTDLGCATTLIRQKFKDCHALILEMNHDETMLKRNPNYAWPLKQRIMSKHGHLSNTDGARLFNDLVTKNTQRVYLAHLSEENNHPDLALKTLEQHASNNSYFNQIDIQIARQHSVSQSISI
jgi:phosphoribosyl 1,2-cyclic phosphodiesterase